MEPIRNIQLFKNYYKTFYVSQTDEVRKKINFVINIIRTVKVIPKKFFQQIEGINGLYEIRVEYNGNIYRVFCCQDKGSLVILFNGFQKKTQKTPLKELKKAEEIMKEYQNSKDK